MTAMAFSAKRAAVTIVGVFLVAGACVAMAGPGVLNGLRARRLGEPHRRLGKAETCEDLPSQVMYSDLCEGGMDCVQGMLKHFAGKKTPGEAAFYCTPNPMFRGMTAVDMHCMQMGSFDDMVADTCEELATAGADMTDPACAPCTPPTRRLGSCPRFPPYMPCFLKAEQEVGAKKIKATMKCQKEMCTYYATRSECVAPGFEVALKTLCTEKKPAAKCLGENDAAVGKICVGMMLQSGKTYAEAQSECSDAACADVPPFACQMMAPLKEACPCSCA